MEFILNDLRGDYVKLVKHVRDKGNHVSARGLATREVTAATLIFNNTLEPLLPIGVGRGVNTKLAALEALQLISGVSRFDLVQIAAPTFASVLVDATDPDYGAYGPRVVEQLADCVEILKTDPSSRQAVAVIWSKDDLRHVGDKPCTIFMQFIIRRDQFGNDALEMHTHMRSQDVWLGVPYDVFMFTQLQHTMAHTLKLPTGRYVHHATSLHLYERNLKDTTKLFLPVYEVYEDDLPMGVVATDPATYPFDVAAYLLEGNTTDEEESVNGWYTHQLDLVEEMIAKTETESVAQ